MRTLIPALLFLTPTALACGSYMPQPKLNTHAIVSVETADGTVSTTEKAGELIRVKDGETEHIATELWSIRDLDVFDGVLIVSGSMYGRPLVAMGDWDSSEPQAGVTYVRLAYQASGRSADVVDVLVSKVDTGLSFAAIVEGTDWEGKPFTVPASATLEIQADVAI